MHQALQARESDETSDVGARLVLRTRKFLLATNALGCESDLARSRLLGIDPKTIGDARRGGTIGGIFVAKTVKVMREHPEVLAEVGIEPTIDAFFDVEVL
jgi:hypothetical protein